MSLGGRSRITFRELCEGVLDLLGKSFTSVRDTRVARIRRTCGRELEFAWNFMKWPDLRGVDMRTYHPVYDAAESVETGFIRYWECGYWKALQDSLGVTPEEGEYWEETQPEQRVIAWKEGASEIGIPMYIGDKDPRWGERGREYKPYIAYDGLHLPPGSPAQVWVEYILPPPSLRGEEWQPDTTYAVDAPVYHPGTGDHWVAIQPGTGQEPADGSTHWKRIEIPGKFREFLTRRIYSSELTNDKQGGKSREQRELAEQALLREMDIATAMVGQTEEISMM